MHILTRLYRPQLSDANIRALLSYKSSGEDRSLTYRYILSPYVYDVLIGYVPRTLAPNAITFVGFLCTLIAHVFVVTYPDSRSCVFGAGCGQLIYMVLDNLDGRQARRTASSSPLGHLFDHGCDAINVTLATLTMTTALRLNLAQAWMFVVLAQIGLVACGIEEYVTGRMILREINGPNEGVLLLVGNLFITSYFGAPAWHVPLSSSSTTSININITPVDLGISATVVAAAGTVIPCGLACYRHRRQNDNGNDNVSIVRIGESFLVYLAFFAGWILISPDTLEEKWVASAWVSSMFVFDYVSKLIIAHLTGDTKQLPRSVTSSALLCLILLPFLKYPLILAVTAVGVVLWRAICLIHQLCHVLDIHCFKLAEQNDDDDARSNPCSITVTGAAAVKTNNENENGTAEPNVEVESVVNRDDLDKRRARLRRRS